MLVVPLSGDTITTSDNVDYEVIAYTNFKPKGPAVYVKSESDITDKAPHLVYFFDIDKINGVKVEMDSGKTFKSFGKIKRKYHLPQPGDEIIVLKPDTPLDQPNDTAEVEKLKLFSKADGISKGMIIVADGVSYRLQDIIRIKRTVGSESFDSKKFLKLYEDYKGFE